MMRRTLPTATLLLMAMILAGCSSLYFNTMEKLGKPKREILVSRVQDARDGQEEAKEQFASALEQFKAVLDYDGGDLEAQYRTLNKEYERSRDKADTVRKRIDSIETVAKALFREWEAELNQYESAELRRASEQSLAETRRDYDQLIAAMRRAEERMYPVLAAFSDQVLFLKHNLNARAIASLEGNLAGIQSDVEALIREMEKSINEANQFIDGLTVEKK